MKLCSRKFVAIILAVFLSLSFVPTVSASPRDDPDFSQRIVRVFKKLQKLLGHSDAPVPPKP